MVYFSPAPTTGSLRVVRRDSNRMRRSYVSVDVVDVQHGWRNGYFEVDAAEARRLIADLAATLVDIETNPARWDDDAPQIAADNAPNQNHEV